MRQVYLSYRGNHSSSFQFFEHVVAEDLVGAGLVAGAGLFEPGDDVGVEAEADGLLDGAVKRPRTAFFQAAAGSSGMSEVSMGRPSSAFSSLSCAAVRGRCV